MTAHYTGGHARGSRITSVLNGLDERVAAAVAAGVVFETRDEWEARLPERLAMLLEAGYDARAAHGRLYVGRRSLVSRFEFDNFIAARTHGRLTASGTT